MHHRRGRSLDGFKGFSDDVVSGLGEYLDGHILRNHIPLDQGPHKLILRVRGRRKSHLNLLKSDFHKHLKKFLLFFQAHRLDQGLVSIP